MPRKNKNVKHAPAFTLVELILVMAILTTLMAVVAPMLSRSFRQRNLDQEAVRLVALIEYGRDEAVSEGVPTVVWADSETNSYGVEAAVTYEGRDVQEKQFSMNTSLHFEPIVSKVQKDGHPQIIQFNADGTPDDTVGSVDSLKILDQLGGSVEVDRTQDRWGYEVVKEAGNATQKH